MHQTALVGVAHVHTPNFITRLLNRADVAVKLVWDHDTARAEASASRLNARAVTDLSAIWADGEVDSVIICSETNRHEELVMAAVAAGKHLFVEKPLGLGAEDAYRMAGAIEEAGLRFQTGYFMRGQPAHLFLREQIKHGNFGQITRARCSVCHAGALEGWFDTDWRWMADLAQAGVGGFGDLGTHGLDVLMWLLGDVEAVTASIDQATGRYDDCDEYGEGLLKFAGGTVGTLAAGWVDVANPVQLILSGTEGHAHIVDGTLYYESANVAGAVGEQPWTPLPDAWPHAFELFLDAVTGKPDVPLVTPHEAAARSAVMEAFYRGAGARTWVTPDTA
jgi:predicted dehydrogenase